MDQNDASGSDSVSDGFLARVHIMQGEDDNCEVRGQTVDLSKKIPYGIDGV